MKIIWAPWRNAYIRGEKEKECFFCRMIKENKDTENYILYRGTYNFVVLNKYPYSPGHIMVVPYAHISNLSELRDEASLEFIHLTNKSIDWLKDSLEPQGFNLGINLGRIAGAGIEDHIHLHIVPRWLGDANFMTIVGETRVISEALNETFKKIKEAMNSRFCGNDKERSRK